MSHALLLVCFASTWFMTGVIWFVQVVHYPLFGDVGAGAFAPYHRRHVRRTTWVVLVPMALELATSAGLVIFPPEGAGRLLPFLGLIAALVCWLSTVLIQVPLHDRLAGGLDPLLVARLVRSNTIRTLAWTGHAGILLAILANAAGWWM
jgi:hypothetical protein